VRGVSVQSGHGESQLMGAVRVATKEGSGCSLEGIFCFVDGWYKVTRMSALFTRLKINSRILLHKKESIK
jgi:hypothetical protein